MIKKWFINNSDIVTVYLYTCQYQFDKNKNSNEYPFDSATIFFERNETKSRKSHARNNYIHIKKENNLICEIGLKMRYDTAIQFLKRLHFSPTIDDVDSFVNENGEYVCIVKEYWDTEVDDFEKITDISISQSYIDDELPF